MCIKTFGSHPFRSLMLLSPKIPVRGAVIRKSLYRTRWNTTTTRMKLPTANYQPIMMPQNFTNSPRSADDCKYLEKVKKKY